MANIDRLVSDLAEIKNRVVTAKLAESPDNLATIDRLRERVEQLKTTIAAKEADIDTLKMAIDDLKAQFTS